METVPIEIYNIILDYLDEITSIISVSKYIHSISKSWILKNCYFKSYCQNNNFTGNIIITNLEQLKCFSKAKKIKFVGEFDDFPISNELKELTVKNWNVSTKTLKKSTIKNSSLEKIKIKYLYGYLSNVPYFNQNLKHLEIYFSTVNSLILPNSLLTLKLGKIPCIPAELPTSLKELKMSFYKHYEYLEQIAMLKNLTQLKILRIKNCKYDLSDILSDSVEILDLGDNYNLILTKLPKNLRELRIGTLEAERLKNIPNINKLTITYFDDLSKFKLEELCIKSTYVNSIKGQSSLKKISSSNIFECSKNLEQYEKIVNTMISQNWKKIRFDKQDIIEIYDNYEDWFNSGTLTENYEYIVNVDIVTKRIYRSLDNGIPISDTYDTIKKR